MRVKDMELLDYFAAQALTMLPNDSYVIEPHALPLIAKSVYDLAEAMMKERQKRKEI